MRQRNKDKFYLLVMASWDTNKKQSKWTIWIYLIFLADKFLSRLAFPSYLSTDFKDHYVSKAKEKKWGVPVS